MSHPSVPCMRAVSYTNKYGKPVIPVNNNWIMSEKYDGQRAIWTGRQMVSRNGIIISIPSWLRDILEKFPFMVDGELYFGRGKFNLTGLFRSSDTSNLMWKKAIFMVFDIPSITLKQPLSKHSNKLLKIYLHNIKPVNTYQYR